MAIVNSNYEFIMVDAGANGKVSDGGVLKNTEFWDRFSSNQLNIPQPSELPSTNQTLPYVLIGDEAFQLTSNFMKPFNQAVLTDERRIYNYRLSRARMVVENTFGILTTRFKIFKRNITLPPQKVRKIVLACCHLHNFLSKRRINYIRRDDVDFEDIQTGTIIPGSWRADTITTLPLQNYRGNSAVEAKRIRDSFCEYFNTIGAVSWQQRCLS